MIRAILILCSLIMLAGCGKKVLPPVEFTAPTRTIDYQNEVRPILVKRCVVCHSCYNSPCQLKLSSFEGLDRGASQKAVYNSSRLETMDPTRLFMDAKTTEEWRGKGFHSVTENSAQSGYNDSIMLQLLSHKKSNPIASGDEFKPEADNLNCPKDGIELGRYLKKHPNGGMPFGFPPLEPDEFDLVAGWLVQGAKGPTEDQKAEIYAISQEDQAKIEKWEEFLNKTDPKHVMTARYLYEHLFLAHIVFDTDSNVFYDLVRSKTPSGTPVDVIATDLPYDPPGVDKFYYRLRKIHSTIVHKTHMVFDFSDQQFDRFQELFITPDWLGTPHIEGYEQSVSGNPFKVFEQIPTRSRYQFLLDNIHYVIMTFIRGPVCKGQVALNVVRDHFWLLFLDPDYDLTVLHPGFLQTNHKYLRMPLVEETDRKLAKSIISRKYRQKSSHYMKKRREFYSTYYRYNAPSYEAIWSGEKDSDTPLLTVFRHFDSASVHAGPLGPLPRTIWVMDYPLVERIYYSLVAGFNVYGTAMHQLSIRIYMDQLRQEGETYFLDFMPKNDRVPLMKDWYGGLDLNSKRISYSPSDLEAGTSFSTEEPKREFVGVLINNHFLPQTKMGFDENYLAAGEDYPEMPDSFVAVEDYIRGFKAVSKPGTSFFTKVDDHNANLAYVRIKTTDNEEEDVYISVVINRWHDDVTTLFGEEQRLNAEKDSAAFIPGFIGSYPNYFLEVELADLPDFLRILDEYDGGEASIAKLERYGVNRAEDDFWTVYDRFQARFNTSDPVKAGLFDLNRYYYLALQSEKDN